MLLLYFTPVKSTAKHDEHANKFFIRFSVGVLIIALLDLVSSSLYVDNHFFLIYKIRRSAALQQSRTLPSPKTVNNRHQPSRHQPSHKSTHHATFVSLGILSYDEETTVNLEAAYYVAIAISSLCIATALFGFVGTLMVGGKVGMIGRKLGG